MIASKRPRATSAVGLGKSPLLRCSWCILDVIMSVHIYKKKRRLFPSYYKYWERSCPSKACGLKKRG